MVVNKQTLDKPIEPEHIPDESEFRYYKTFVVQDVNSGLGSIGLPISENIRYLGVCVNE
jgi:hypothetical protein